MALFGPLIGYILWQLLLVATVFNWRGISILRRERGIHQFPSGEKHGSDRYWRMNRAHLNAAENLPVFAALVIMVHLLVPADERHIYELAAHVVLFARVCQSIVHVAFNTPISVTFRFLFFFTQVGTFAFMAVKLLLR